jgi:hypothetical protein
MSMLRERTCPGLGIIEPVKNPKRQGKREAGEDWGNKRWSQARR